MKISRTSAVADFRLNSRFEALRKKLLADRNSARLEKPLAYWALPRDRRLPLAFLDRPLGELLNTPFDDLYRTPGVGHKKIESLVRLLSRAARDREPMDETKPVEVNGDHVAVDEVGDEFDPASVSESIWSRWQIAVRRNGLGPLPLGRFAPSLQRLPRVLWSVELETYLDRTLQDIRQLKTHGEKRVAAVLEVFDALYRVIGNLDPSRPGTLAVRIMPPFVAEIESWIYEVRFEGAPISAELLDTHFYRPMLAQIEGDAGKQVAELAAGRLGLDDTTGTVRQVARRMGLTRARIYQLLAEVGAIMDVRWPTGAALVSDTIFVAAKEELAANDIDRLGSAMDLFFPALRSEREAQADHAASSDEPQRRAG